MKMQNAISDILEIVHEAQKIKFSSPPKLFLTLLLTLKNMIKIQKTQFSDDSAFKFLLKHLYKSKFKHNYVVWRLCHLISKPAILVNV